MVRNSARVDLAAAKAVETHNSVHKNDENGSGEHVPEIGNQFIFSEIPKEVTLVSLSVVSTFPLCKLKNLVSIYVWIS